MTWAAVDGNGMYLDGEVPHCCDASKVLASVTGKQHFQDRDKKGRQHSAT